MRGSGSGTWTLSKQDCVSPKQTRRQVRASGSHSSRCCCGFDLGAEPPLAAAGRRKSGNSTSLVDHPEQARKAWIGPKRVASFRGFCCCFWRLTTTNPSATRVPGRISTNGELTTAFKPSNHAPLPRRSSLVHSPACQQAANLAAFSPVPSISLNCEFVRADQGSSRRYVVLFMANAA